MNKLITDTLNKIQSQHIAPEPRWKYLVKKYGMWAAFAAIVFFGGAALSAVFSGIGQLDWDLYRFTHQSVLDYIFSILPYFWIFLIGILLTVAFWDMRKTEMGYRFSRWKIFFFTIVGVLVFGFFLSYVGVGNSMNTMMANNVYMQNMITTKQSQWSQPQNGLLSGQITALSNGNFLLQDFSGNNWVVSFDQNTLLRPSFKMAQGVQIKVIGSYRGGNNFAASEIRPWQGGGMMQGFDSSNTSTMRSMMNESNGNNVPNGGGMMQNGYGGSGMMGR